MSIQSNFATLAGKVDSSGNVPLNGSAQGVTGTLQVANGGTGATSLATNSILKGNGTSAVTAASAADIVAAIGTTAVANATTAASTSGNANTASNPQSGGSFITSLNIASQSVSHADTAGSTPLLSTANFTVIEASGKLIFKYGTTVIASMDSTGVFITTADIVSYGTP